MNDMGLDLDSGVNSIECSVPPLVSVIMPSYNHVGFVEEAIRSVWNQGYPNLEIIVVDDASSDGTAELVESLVARSPIPMRVQLKSVNSGVSNSLNLGVSLALGDWISFLSSDDYFVENKIERQVSVAQLLGVDFGCIHSDGYSVDADGRSNGRNFVKSGSRPLQGDAFDDLLYNRARIIPTSALLNKALIVQVGGFDESFVAEDYDFYLRLSRHTKFHFIDEALVNVRVSESSLGRQPWRWAYNVFAAINKHADLSGYDWDRVRAERWFTLLPGFLEHGSLLHIRRALIDSSRAAWSAGVYIRYIKIAARALARAIAFRLKLALVRFTNLRAAKR